jgi:hypothetical protein
VDTAENETESWVVGENKKIKTTRRKIWNLPLKMKTIFPMKKPTASHLKSMKRAKLKRLLKNLSNMILRLILAPTSSRIFLLNELRQSDVQVTKEELEQNKDKIVETLINFKIGISSIKATIGPTVTLYEIVPDAGVKISRIKNLEDDIALSLSALGIRIIAPIPGKGTIGIEVPNKNREMVSVKSVLATERFKNSKHELPVILGKTISNEVYLADLSKMPHLLMAGATGQGKSVGSMC